MSDLVKVTEKSIAPFITPKQQDFIALIGEDNLKRETSFAIQAVNANDYLSQATPQSVAKAIWNVAITGLSLNPIHKLAYITPRKVGNNLEALLMPSYQGLCKLLTDTGSVKTVYAHPVYKGDDFDIELGERYSLSHKPKFLSKEITHVYAVAILHDGTKQFEVMSAEQISEIRDLSDGYKAFKAGRAKTAIWDSFYDEMCRKTVIKRLTKYLPKTDKWERLNEAIEVDNSIYPATLNQEEKILRLVKTSAYDDSQRSYIEAQVEAGISKVDADKIISDLELNQLNPVTHGGQIGAKEANDAVNQRLLIED